VSEFICPVLISTDLAGRIFFVMAPCCDSAGWGGGEGSLASGFLPQQNAGPTRWEEGRVQSLCYILYARMGRPLNGTARSGGEQGAVSRK